MDEKAQRILGILKYRKRDCTDVMLSQSSHYSLSVVRKRLAGLAEAGLVEEYWIENRSTSGVDRGPYYRLSAPPED